MLSGPLFAGRHTRDDRISRSGCPWHPVLRYVPKPRFWQLLSKCVHIQLICGALHSFSSVAECWAGNKYTLKGLLAFANASRITFGTDFLFGNTSLMDASTKGLDAFFGAGGNNTCTATEENGANPGVEGTAACLGAGGAGAFSGCGCLSESAATSALAAINRGNAEALLPRLAAAQRNSTKL